MGNHNSKIAGMEARKIAGMEASFSRGPHPLGGDAAPLVPIGLRHG